MSSTSSRSTLKSKSRYERVNKENQETRHQPHQDNHRDNETIQIPHMPYDTASSPSHASIYNVSTDSGVGSTPISPLPNSPASQMTKRHPHHNHTPHLSDTSDNDHHFDEQEFMDYIQRSDDTDGGGEGMAPSSKQRSISSASQPSSSTASSAAAATAAAAANRVTLFLSWASLLVAVFSMSAVGPMFLWLEKQHVSPILAIVWRQTTQTFCLIIPCVIEYYRTPLRKRKWWKLKVPNITADASHHHGGGDDDDDDDSDGASTPSDQEQLTDGEENTDSLELSVEPVTSIEMTRRIQAAEFDSNEEDEIKMVEAMSESFDDIHMTVGHRTPDVEGDVDVQEKPNAKLIESSTFGSVTFTSLSSHPMFSMFLISLFWSISVSGWVISLPFTSAARASLFSSLYPLFIIGWLRCYHGVKVSLGEILGVCVCLVGIATSEVMSSLNPDTNTLIAQENTIKSTFNGTDSLLANSTDVTLSKSHSIFPVDNLSPSELQLLGDFICIFSSIFIALDVVTSAPTRKVVPLFSFSLCTSLMTFIQLFVLTILLEGSTLDMHPVTGVFGWVASTEMLVRVFLFGFLVGMVGILGFNYSVGHINPIIFSTVQLLDPGLAGIMSALGGIEGWPVLSTYIGVTIVTAGILLVVVYQTRRETREAEEKKKLQQAAKSKILVREAE